MNFLRIRITLKFSVPYTGLVFFLIKKCFCDPSISFEGSDKGMNEIKIIIMITRIDSECESKVFSKRNKPKAQYIEYLVEAPCTWL